MASLRAGLFLAGNAKNRFSPLLNFLLIWLPVETNSEFRGQAGTVFRNRAEPWMAEPERTGMYL